MARQAELADRLYVLRPSEFRRARDEAAAEARAHGDSALATSIRALRRPTVAAWAANLLARQQPEQAEELVRLGEDMREARRGIGAERMRALTRQRHEVVGALARQAVRLTAEAGQRIGPEAQRQVEETLHAVLADEVAARQWLAGHLVHPLSAAGDFDVTDADDTGQAREEHARQRVKKAQGTKAQRAKTQGAKTQGTKTQGTKAQRAKASTQGAETSRTAARERSARLTRARREAEQAKRELRAAEQQRAAAENEARHASERRELARQRVAELTEHLRIAAAEERGADREERSTRQRVARAEREERRARRQAEQARALLDRLATEASPRD
jgi:hypothetical protein